MENNTKSHEITLEEWLDTSDIMCIDITNRKYLLDADILGHKETASEMLDRVSGGNSAAKALIIARRFIPGGRILSNRGLTKYGVRVTYSNCYVSIPVDDSIESIYETCGKLARTFSYGGGIGIDISKLAPSGAIVRNSAKRSTGAVSFVPTFSQVAETIGQNNRRGALMISICDTHPDLEQFITHKSDLKLTTGANMSVRMSNEFFEAVENDAPWTMRFERKETGEIIEKTVKARYLMSLLAETNWKFAEPGILYWDHINNWNLMSEDEDFSYAGVNPCAEETLPAGGSCLLGAMNLSEYFNKEISDFDYDTFDKDVATAVDYLNEVLDEGQPLHPLEEQKETVTNLRQIGLGFMGLGDLFINMKIRYGSEASISLIHKIGYHMIFAAIKESCELAKKYGAFKACKPEAIVASKFFQYNVLMNQCKTKEEIDTLYNDVLKYGLRNSQLLTCAPTGTTSTIFNVSGGIEPIFAMEFNRTTKTVHKTDYTYQVNPKAIKEWLKENGLKSIKDVKELPEYLVTSRDIDWMARLNVQAAWQEHIDASISSTINLPESTTVQEIEDLYKYARAVGCKGTTVYRENCERTAILIDTFNKSDDKNKKSEENKSETKPAKAKSKEAYKLYDNILTRKELGKVLPGNTYYEQVACGHIYITVNRYHGKPVEVFMQSSKSGGCSANTNALGRMASTMLRSGIDPNIVIDSTFGVQCAACSSLKGKGEPIDGKSCSDVMARVIRQEYENYINGLYDDEIPDGEEAIAAEKEKYISDCSDYEWNWKEHTAQENIDHKVCPECGLKLKKVEGCIKCLNCGFSKC